MTKKFDLFLFFYFINKILNYTNNYRTGLGGARRLQRLARGRGRRAARRRRAGGRREARTGHRGADVGVLIRVIEVLLAAQFWPSGTLVDLPIDGGILRDRGTYSHLISGAH